MMFLPSARLPMFLRTRLLRRCSRSSATRTAPGDDEPPGVQQHPDEERPPGGEARPGEDDGTVTIDLGNV